jgi:hypothetical protein
MSGVIIEDIDRDSHNYFQPSALGQYQPLSVSPGEWLLSARSNGMDSSSPYGIAMCQTGLRIR